MKTANDNKIRKVLFNEVTFIVALISLVTGVVFWVSNPQNEMEIKIVRLESQVENNQTVQLALEAIKNNDLHEVQLKMDEIEERQIRILEALASIKQQLINLDN